MALKDPQPASLQPGKRWQLIFAWLLAAAVMGLAWIYGPELVQVLRRVDLGWTVAGAVCYGINYLLRAQRFRMLSDLRIRVWPEGLHAACLHGFATYILPFRSGELTLPVVLRSVSNMALVEGGQVLVRARLLDLTVLGFLAMGAALMAEIAVSAYFRAGWFAIGILLVAVQPLLRWLTASPYAARLPLVHRISGWNIWKRFTAGEIFLSLGIWTAVAGCLFCVTQALGLPINIPQVCLLVTIQLPLQLLPVQGLANAGNHEGAWVAGLLLLGVSASAALEFALASHAILLLYVIGLGPAGLIIGLWVPTASSAS